LWEGAAGGKQKYDTEFEETIGINWSKAYILAIFFFFAF
jgi:hypothetical protein